MAERERLTNKERRALAREERKRKEAEAAAKRKRAQLRNGLATAAVVAVIAAVLLQAFLGGPDTVAGITLAQQEAADARVAAGCEMLAEREPHPDPSHFPEGQLPDADAVYTGIRPTHSGPHSPDLHPILTASRQIDEVVSTHNLEHGSVIVWYDPDLLESDAIEDWAESLNESGFEGQPRSGVGIITSPFVDPGLPEGMRVAFRAWGTAMECEAWDETVAHSFVLDHFGTHGIGPERMLAPFPDDVLAYEDADVDDTPEDEAPIDDDPMLPDEAPDEEPVEDEAADDD